MLAAVLLTGCQGAQTPAPAEAPAPLTTELSVPAPSPPPAPAASSAAPAVRPLTGKLVVLDPGHNGGTDPAALNAQVPNGRGRTKACNTTGTSTAEGYAEHAFTWALAQQVQQLLTAQGATVRLTRDSDSGLGPCVDQRAAAGAGADVVVSLHGDGAPPSGRGFHVAYSAPPLSAVQSGPSVRLATTMRDAMVAGGLTPSTYLGSDGLNPRSDLAGLNLATGPAVLVECANLRNPAEAAAVSTPAGRTPYARAIADGITRFLTTG